MNLKLEERFDVSLKVNNVTPPYWMVPGNQAWNWVTTSSVESSFLVTVIMVIYMA